MRPAHFGGLLATLVLLLAGAEPSAVRGEDSPAELLDRATKASAQGRSDEAVAALDRLLAQAPDHAPGFYLRGREQFRLGRYKESVADFDKYVSLVPPHASRQWERGISLYYAGEFTQGAKQFALYQTYHNADVENAAWRFLCHVEVDGLAKARADMLPIKQDSRVPMMQIYDLFRGKLKPDDVFAAAEAGAPLKDELNQRLFYAHLYVGLYYEATREHDLARKHLVSAEQHKIEHYMWDVAHQHAERLREKK